MRAVNGSIVHNDVVSVEPDIGTSVAYTDGGGLRHVMPASNIIRLYEMLVHDAKAKNLNFEIWADAQMKAANLRLTAPERKRLPSSWLEKDEVDDFLSYVSSMLCLPVNRDFTIAVPGSSPRATTPAHAVYVRGAWHNLTLNKTSKRWGVPDGVRELVEGWRRRVR